uniref:hypothetical protein n=1 Tax=Brucella pseudintermedia TaxID=370111 RepID=UPI0015883D19|nr:hypothetical protein [Brucella pseudintermedia]
MKTEIESTPIDMPILHTQSLAESCRGVLVKLRPFALRILDNLLFESWKHQEAQKLSEALYSQEPRFPVEDRLITVPNTITSP